MSREHTDDHDQDSAGAARGTAMANSAMRRGSPATGEQALPAVHGVHLLLVSGSTRAGSTNTAALRTALAIAGTGVAATLFDGLAQLPAFNPDDDHDPLPAPVAELRRLIAAADAVVFSTPEYAGALPGTFKNLLDWTVGGGELYRKPVAWINVAAEGRGGNAHASLATVLGYVGANILDPACARLAVPARAVTTDGLIDDAGLRAQISRAVQTIAHEARQRPRSGEH